MSEEKRRIPPDLLTWSTDMRLDFFKKVVIKHKKLEDTHNKLMDYIRGPARASIIFVVGPTGVGKTTVRYGVEKQIKKELLPDLVSNPGRIAVASTEVVGPEPGKNFNWRDLYERSLEALHEPLIDEKILVGEESTPGIQYINGQLVVNNTVYSPKLRRAFEKCLKHRCPLAFFYDEAQHFTQVSGEIARKKQMDTLKSLSSKTSVTLVLFGTYELLQCWKLSGQLNRRTKEVHFPRYRPDLTEDIEVFKNALEDFHLCIPLLRKPDFSKWEFFYQGSAGCIGLLKTWLDASVAQALKEGKEELTQEHLNNNAMPPSKLIQIANEIIAGEKKLEETEAQWADLRLKLGMGAIPVEETKRKQKKGKKIGRKPERDQVA